jgi:hypothetical protein
MHTCFAWVVQFANCKQIHLLCVYVTCVPIYTYIHSYANLLAWWCVVQVGGSAYDIHCCMYARECKYLYVCACVCGLLTV